MSENDGRRVACAAAIITPIAVGIAAIAAVLTANRYRRATARLQEDMAHLERQLSTLRVNVAVADIAELIDIPEQTQRPTRQPETRDTLLTSGCCAANDNRG